MKSFHNSLRNIETRQPRERAVQQVTGQLDRSCDQAFGSRTRGYALPRERQVLP